MLPHKRLYFFLLFAIAALLALAWVLPILITQAANQDTDRSAIDPPAKDATNESLAPISTIREDAQWLSVAELVSQELDAGELSAALALQMGKPYIAAESSFENDPNSGELSAALALQMGKPYIAAESGFESELDPDFLSP